MGYFPKINVQSNPERKCKWVLRKCDECDAPFNKLIDEKVNQELNESLKSIGYREVNICPTCHSALIARNEKMEPYRIFIGAAWNVIKYGLVAILIFYSCNAS